LGADFVATGHYVRRDVDPQTGRYRLLKAAQGSELRPFPDASRMNYLHSGD
jgi:tRNA U34 2-thiouridine synthase MnmA/TrmU